MTRPVPDSRTARRIEVVVIGGSAGSLQALTSLLPAIGTTFPVPVVLVVHIPMDQPSALPLFLRSIAPIEVREAEDKLALTPGAIYVAVPDYHVLLEAGGTLALSRDAPVHSSRPSIDVLFESAGHAYGSRALGILLSGANADGAAGLQTMYQHGATTWVQAPSSATSVVMPLAALALAPHVTYDPATMGRELATWGARHE